MSASEQKPDFDTMLRSMEGIVRRVCLLYTDRQPDSINDLYQEIAYALWVGYPRFRGGSSLTTWVYSVSLRTAANYLRYRRRHPVTLSLSTAMADTLADGAGDDPLITQLYALIDRLKESERSLMMLYLDGLPLRAIADVLHTNENTVKQRLKYLKNKLKRMNDEEQ